MRRAITGVLVIILLLVTSCSGITVDTKKMKAEYNAGYVAGYTRGFIDGVASCNKTLEIK